MDAGNVKWVRLGDYIEQCDERNHSNKYGIEAIKGISTSKTFIDTKGEFYNSIYPLVSDSRTL